MPRGSGEGVGWTRIGVSRCQLLPLERINNKVLLCSAGNYLQSLGIEHDGRQHEKKTMYIYLHVYAYIQQKLAQHCKSTIMKKKKHQKTKQKNPKKQDIKLCFAL